MGAESTGAGGGAVIGAALIQGLAQRQAEKKRAEEEKRKSIVQATLAKGESEKDAMNTQLAALKVALGI